MTAKIAPSAAMTGHDKASAASPQEPNQGLRALRGVAALLVFLQHIFGQANLVHPGPVDLLYALNPGAAGVLIFFGLSAFLLTGKAKDPPAKFLADRARRIVPGLWAALLLANTLDYLRLGTNGLTWQVFLLLPFGHQPDVSVPYWSLYYEALLYAVIFLIARISARAVGPAILIWAVVAWIYQDRPYGNGHYLFPTWYYLAFPIFAGFFAVGILVSWRRARPAPERRRATVACCCVLSILCFAMPITSKFPLTAMIFWAWPSGWLPTPLKPDIGFFYYLAAVGFALRAASLWRADGMFGRTMRIFGDLSYGIYLTHIAFMYVGTWLLIRSGISVSYGVAAILLAGFALPPSMLFGWWELRSQQWLKVRLQKAWPIRRQQPLASMAIQPEG